MTLLQKYLLHEVAHCMFWFCKTPNTYYEIVYIIEPYYIDFKLLKIDTRIIFYYVTQLEILVCCFALYRVYQDDSSNATT